MDRRNLIVITLALMLVVGALLFITLTSIRGTEFKMSMTSSTAFEESHIQYRDPPQQQDYVSGGSCSSCSK